MTILPFHVLPLFALQPHTFPPRPSVGWLPTPGYTSRCLHPHAPTLLHPPRPTIRVRGPGACSRTKMQKLGRDGLSDACAPAGDDAHSILQQAVRQAALTFGAKTHDGWASEGAQGRPPPELSYRDRGRGQA